MPASLRRLLAPAALLVALGCGLANYEENIDKQHKRIKLFDEENKILGDIIGNPAKSEEDKALAWPFGVYLRLPRKVGATPVAVYQGTSARLSLYQYAGPDGLNVFVAAGMLVEKAKDGEYKAGEWTDADFRAELVQGLKAYYRKEYKIHFQIPPGLPFKPDTRKPMSPQGTPLPDLPFEVAAITDAGANPDVKDRPSTFLIFHHQSGGRQAGVIYQLPKLKLEANDEATLKLLDYSIRSLDILNAAQKQQEFLKAKSAS